MPLPEARHASWRSLLAIPPRPAHMVQLCESHAALARGAAHFVAEGLWRGEAVVLTGTKPHVEGIRRELAWHGIDMKAALFSGQLTVGDAHEAVEAVSVNGLPDKARFEAVAGEVLAKVRSDTRFSGVRWWGEMSNVYRSLGNRRAVQLDEEIGDAICRAHEVSLLCSFQCDLFDAAGYDGALQDVCCRHDHVIPVEDYPRHRAAVNAAVGELLGELDSAQLRALWGWKGLSRCDLPASQEVLFWLRDSMPELFPQALARTRELFAGEAQ